MQDDGQMTLNPFQPPLSLPDGDSPVPLWRFVAAALGGLVGGGLAGGVLAGPAYLLLHHVALVGASAELRAICLTLGMLLGAASGAIAGVRLIKAPRVRGWLIWTAAGLVAAGYAAICYVNDLRGMSLLAVAITGSFSGMVAGAIICAFLPRKPAATHEAAQQGQGNRRASRTLAIGLTATVLVVASFVQIFNANVSQGYLGVTYREETDSLANDARQSTIVVTGVARDSGAYAAGIRAGDQIVAIEGQPAETTHNLRDALRHRRAGETIAIDLAREDRHWAVEIQLMDVYAVREAIYERAEPSPEEP